MDRRQFMQGLGAGLVSVNLPAYAEQRSMPRVVVMGIGGAGCNLVTAFRAITALDRADLSLDYVCLDLGPRALQVVEAANAAAPAQKPIKTLMLAPLGAGGRVNAARAVALRQRKILQGLTVGSDIVVLVAGLGGGTGSGIAPIMARWAKQAGAVTYAVVVTPFDFEGTHNIKATSAFAYLQREADMVMAFSNEKWAQRYGDDSPMIEVLNALNRHAVYSINGFLGFASKLIGLSS